MYCNQPFSDWMVTCDEKWVYDNNANRKAGWSECCHLAGNLIQSLTKRRF